MQDELRNNPNFRIQDAVSATSGTSLVATVRMLRTLVAVAQVSGYEELADSLREALSDSAQADGYAAALHTRPTSGAWASTQRAKELVKGQFGQEFLDDLSSLDNDPFVK